MTYFSTGDLRISKHGRRVRLEASTTHSAQMKMLLDLFGKYATPIVYAYMPNAHHYAWRLVYDLDISFNFLRKKVGKVGSHISEDDELFYAALSGFVDAEGHVGLHIYGEWATVE